MNGTIREGVPEGIVVGGCMNTGRVEATNEARTSSGGAGVVAVGAGAVVAGNSGAGAVTVDTKAVTVGSSGPDVVTACCAATPDHRELRHNIVTTAAMGLIQVFLI